MVDVKALDRRGPAGLVDKQMIERQIEIGPGEQPGGARHEAMDGRHSLVVRGVGDQAGAVQELVLAGRLLHAAEPNAPLARDLLEALPQSGRWGARALTRRGSQPAAGRLAGEEAG